MVKRSLNRRLWRLALACSCAMAVTGAGAACSSGTDPHADDGALPEEDARPGLADPPDGERSDAGDGSAPDQVVADASTDAPDGDGAVASGPCTSCALITAGLTTTAGFLAIDGQRVLFDLGSNGSEILRVGAVNIDGTNRVNFTGSNCGYNLRNQTIFGGYVYLSQSPAPRHAAMRFPLTVAGNFTCDRLAPGDQQTDGYVFAIEAAANKLFAKFSDGRLVSVDLATLSTTTLAQSLTVPPMVVDDSAVFAGRDTGGATYQNIQRWDRVTGVRTQSVTPTKPIWPMLLKTDATYVYYVSDYRLYRLPKATLSGTPELLGALPTSKASLPEFHTIVDGDDVVYWTYGGAGIGRIPIAGGTATILPTGNRKVTGVTFDATRYVFTSVGMASTSTHDLWSVPR